MIWLQRTRFDLAPLSISDRDEVPAQRLSEIVVIA